MDGQHPGRCRGRRSGRHVAHVLIAAVLPCLGVGCSATDRPVDHPQDVRALIQESIEHVDVGFRPVGSNAYEGYVLDEPPAYRIGVGDSVQVIVPGVEDFAGFGETSTGEAVGTQVKEDGHIYLPILVRVEAAGRTALELQEHIRGRLDVEAQRGVFVSVDVVRYNSQRYYVFGQVNRPGAYAVDGRATLLDAISEGGGVNAQAGDVREGYVLRRGHVLPIALSDVLYRGHPVGRIPMQDRDVVFVPHASDHQDRVYVLGEVRSPGVVAMRHDVDDAGLPGPGRLTLAHAIASVGGLEPETADHNAIRIFRGSCDGVRAFTLGAHEVYRHGERILLAPGDRVLVAPSEAADYERAVRASMPFLQGAGALAGLGLAATALSR